MENASNDSHRTWPIRFLLLVAGLGGLVYGIDGGIIAGALPYLEATAGLNANQLSVVVAAVLLGSVLSTLFAGALSDWMGRKKLMALGGLVFVASIPMIALADGYGPLVLGRLLQGISAGLVGVAVPLYLAECLPAQSRGKGTGIFQWLLALGIVAAAVIAFYFSLRVEEVEKLNDADKLFAFKDMAWRNIFWYSLPPGVLFVIGSLLVPESPRWLFRRGKKEAVLAALRCSRSQQQAALELQEMEEVAAAEKVHESASGKRTKESLLHRKYVIPFILACVILICNQAIGMASIIGYNATILIQAGLSDKLAHLGYVIMTAVLFLATMVGVTLVDRKGRKFLLSLGTAGVFGSLICTGLIFHRTEKHRVDCADAVQAMVDNAEQKARITFNRAISDRLLAEKGEAGKAIAGQPTSLIVIYSYGDFRAATKVLRSDDKTAKPLEITRDSCVPSNRVVAFFSNPFANLEMARIAPLKIENVLISPVPSTASGWLTAACIFSFTAFFSVGPGICVWLALSELMPTRIRSNGMSVALVLNQAVMTAIAAVFLPTVGKFGYSTVFFGFAGCAVIYFLVATFLLPETKGKTLEEIEEYFSSHSGGRSASPKS